MLTGLKLLSFASKCVFCRPEHNAKRGGGGMELNFKVLEMQKWNITTGRARCLDDKNTVVD